MSGRKRSGAQNRKRKKEAEIAFKKSSVLLAVFLKKAKKEVEAPNTSSSESEDGGYQPSAYPYQPKKFWGAMKFCPNFVTFAQIMILEYISEMTKKLSEFLRQKPILS